MFFNNFTFLVVLLLVGFTETRANPIYFKTFPDNNTSTFIAPSPSNEDTVLSKHFKRATEKERVVSWSGTIRNIPLPADLENDSLFSSKANSSVIINTLYRKDNHTFRTQTAYKNNQSNLTSTVWYSNKINETFDIFSQIRQTTNAKYLMFGLNLKVNSITFSNRFGTKLNQEDSFNVNFKITKRF